MADRIVMTTNRKITDHLVSRLPGTAYDTYYRALEELTDSDVVRRVNTAINDTLIPVADPAGLRRWEFFYTDKPYDMTYDEWRRLLLILNLITREGPTEANVLKLLRYFDPSATYAVIKPLPVYASETNRSHIELTWVSEPTTVVTTFPWIVGNYNVDGQSRIYTRDVGTGLLRVYREGTDYLTTFDESSGLLRIQISGLTVAAGTELSIAFENLAITTDPPASQFFNEFTGSYPTAEYAIVDQDSLLPVINEFVLYEDAFVAYKTSVLYVPKLTYRKLLRDLLDMLLPANVVFLLVFASLDPIVYIMGNDTLPNMDKAIGVFEPTYDKFSRFDIFVPGEEGTSIRWAIALSETEFLVNLVGNPGYHQAIYKYNVNDATWEAITASGYAGINGNKTVNNKILLTFAGGYDKASVVYDIVSGTSTTTTTPAYLPDLASNDVRVVNVTPQGDAVMQVCDTRYLDYRRWVIYIYDIMTNSIKVTYQDPAMATHASGIWATGENNVIVAFDTEILYLTMEADSSITPVPQTFNFSPLYNGDQLIKGPGNILYFCRMDAAGMQIYRATFGAMPTLIRTVTEIGGGKVWLLNESDLMIAGGSKVVILSDFVDHEDTASATEKFVAELIQPFVSPQDIITGGNV